MQELCQPYFESSEQPCKEKMVPADRTPRVGDLVKVTQLVNTETYL